MADDLCPHDGDPHTCPPCQRAAGRIADPKPPAPLFDFIARYDSATCRGCGVSSLVGQDATKWDDDAITHRTCPR